MAKKKAKAKSTARTTHALSKKDRAEIKRQAKFNLEDIWNKAPEQITVAPSKKEKYSMDKRELIANMVRYHIQDNGINTADTYALDDLEEWVLSLLKQHYD